MWVLCRRSAGVKQHQHRYIKAMKWIFKIFAITYASTLFSADNCDLFTNPESCLGRTPEALSEVQYGISERKPWMEWPNLNPTDDEIKNKELLYVAERNNPLGLFVEITTYNNVIYNIKLSTSTARLSPTQEEFKLFQDSIRATRPSESWIFKERGANDSETYDNGDIRIIFFRNAVIIHSRAIGPPR